MQRLFIAVPIPDQEKEKLLNLHVNIPGTRWIEKDQLHITLKFIGEVDGQNLRIIRDSLSEIVTKQFSIRLMGVGFFPPGNLPKVLWAGLENHEQLTRLRNKIESNLFYSGIKKEHRKFRPHVTLARLKNVQTNRVSSFFSSNVNFKTDSFIIDEFRLYSSKLYPKGAVHSIEAVYSLK